VTNASEFTRTLPLLNVVKFRSDELNVSPDCKYKGACDLIYDAVGFVKIRSYAIETSPADVKFVGKLEVTPVSEIENIEVPLSFTFNKFPIVPFEPMLIENKSPVAIVDELGDQSKLMRPPVVSPVEVDER